MQRKTGRFATLAMAVFVCAFASVGVAQAQCPNDAFRAGVAAGLPDCRAYELVSPADKDGRDVFVDNSLFRIAETESGSASAAAMFPSLGGFGDVLGSGVTFEYVAQRNLAPGTQGWSTHAVTPPQEATPYKSVVGVQSPAYVGDADGALTRALFRAWSPIGPAPNTALVDNLYLRADLRTPGAGTYQLLTDAFAPVTPSAGPTIMTLPNVAGTSSDLSHVLFESPYRLTANAPAGSSPKLYESVNGIVRLVGILPASQGGGAAPRSIAGQGAGSVFPEFSYTPHVLSTDGSRAFFTVGSDDQQVSGALYMRDDMGTADTSDDQTVQINASERTSADSTQPATYWNAAGDGSRVFFTTTQALTDDAPVGNIVKLYVYNADVPASDPHNLTYISADQEPADFLRAVLGVLGVSDDGKTAYFLQSGQIVAGEPVLNDGIGIYVWHEGAGVRYIGQMVDDQADPTDDLPGSAHRLSFHPWQLGNRVTPDGRYLLLSLRQPPWPGGFDQGNCDNGLGCRELYLYDFVAGGHPRCISCGTSVPTTPTFYATRTGEGGSAPSTHQNSPMLPDGSVVFFTTQEALLAQDVNGRDDVYEYDVADGTLHLITSGQSTEDAFFLDVTPNGHDVYFATREQLSPWDTDQNMDVYDARVDGGVPAPPPPAVPCAGDACHGAIAPAPAALTVSSVLRWLPPVVRRPKAPKPAHCRAPKVRRRVHGKVRCLTRAQARKLRRAKRARAAHRSGHEGTRGAAR